VPVPGLLAFPRTASGDVAPSRVVAGAATHFDNFTNQLAYDPAADEIYADTGINRGYAVFAGTANGNVAPARMVVGPDSKLHSLRGIAFDAANQRVIVVDSANNFKTPTDTAMLRVFQRTDDGDVPAIMTVGGPSTMMVSPASIALDQAGGFTGTGDSGMDDAGTPTRGPGSGGGSGCRIGSDGAGVGALLLVAAVVIGTGSRSRTRRSIAGRPGR
jgi:hypothetical protein